MMPPRMTAAHTCRWVRLTGPSHANGDTHSAKTIPMSHWKAMSPAKSRSVRWWIRCQASAKIWLALSDRDASRTLSGECEDMMV